MQDSGRSQELEESQLGNIITGILLQGYLKQDTLMLRPLRHAVSLLVSAQGTEIQTGETRVTLTGYRVTREERTLRLELGSDNHQDRDALGRFMDRFSGKGSESGECKELELKCYTKQESQVLFYGLQHFQFMRRLSRHETLCALGGQETGLESVVAQVAEEHQKTYRISLSEFWKVLAQIEHSKEELTRLKAQQKQLEAGYVRNADGYLDYIDQTDVSKDSQVAQMKTLNQMILSDLTSINREKSLLKKEVERVMSCKFGMELEEGIKEQQESFLQAQEDGRRLQIEIQNLRKSNSSTQEEQLDNKRRQNALLLDQLKSLQERADPAEESLATLRRQQSALQERQATAERGILELQVKRRVYAQQLS